MVGQCAVVAEVERDVIDNLRERNHYLSKGVGDTGLIHDIRILPCEIDHHDSRPQDQIENILHYN